MRAIAFIRAAAGAIFFTVAVLLIAASCDKASTLQYEEEEPAQMQSIASLKRLCSEVSFAIREDITVRGTVVANDRYGEFYKTVVIEDGSGGISIALDRTDLADDYPIGARLTIYCNGLWLCNYGGKIELGALPGQYGAGRIAESQIARYIHCDMKADEAPRPNVITFSEVDSRHIDTFVQFEGVWFAEDAPWCDIDPETKRPVTTERMMSDGQGNSFWVRTAGTCLYASESLPRGKGSVSGVIDYFDRKYTLRVVNRGIDGFEAGK